ncbi:precorrin-6y C5,15-methyltransferase (decarboxylating) subunit CbiE [Streptomyces sp. AC627_RSS907]|uniref:precorrin-6y C5,15-methyltransferase (decarboxylating) subunit CbiE n=1 Tax=Streptomyces sp. AC627_RSS907 TaxID=2823684 RepID=UPI001C2158AE|nr:precorrin-6y C5,15-methyltransferase (decarboxylating) subunit CbiE [Streptomyces sp. AC627_RSS907]
MIRVVGAGTGSPLPEDVADGAELVVGGRRHLDAVRLPEGAERVVLGALAPALDTVAEYVANERPVLVLASGDPGFFGIVRALAERFGPELLDVRPGVSSVAAAFARVGLPWDDAVVASAHGRDLRTAVNVCRAHPKAAVLTGPGAGPAELGAALRDDGTRVLVVASALGSAEERVERVTPAEAAARDWGTAVSVVLCLDEARALGPVRTIAGPWSGSGGRPGAARGADAGGRPGPVAGGAGRDGGAAPGVQAGPGALPRRPGTDARAERGSQGGHGVRVGRAGPGGWAGWALDEGAFAHRDSMITKFEVRALALARLGPRPGDLVWDVGAGSGSVAVECARLGAAVTAVEKTPDGAGRVRANAAAHGVDVRVVHGAAPAALAGLDDPDAVFVGGGGRELPAIVAACARRTRRVVVVAMAALDRVPAAREALLGAGLDCDGVLLQSSRLAPLPGDVTRLAATNPVFLLWGTRPRTRTEGVRQ